MPGLGWKGCRTKKEAEEARAARMQDSDTIDRDADIRDTNRSETKRTRVKLDTYAWPGGYPLYYLATDNSVLCPKCANDEDELPTAHGINYEDAALYCDGCNQRIESAYAEDEATDGAR